METSADPREPRRTITFERVGPNPFRGDFYVRGTHCEEFRLTSSVGRIPQDACDAVKTAISRLESGAPDAFEQAVAALNAVSGSIIFDWSR